MRLSAFQAVLVISVRTPSAMPIATTCNELRPLALSADAASGVASIVLRSDCKSSSLVCATTSSTFERTAGCSSFDDLYAPYHRAGLTRRGLCLGLRGCSLCLHESRRPQGERGNNDGCRKDGHGHS